MQEQLNALIKQIIEQSATFGAPNHVHFSVEIEGIEDYEGTVSFDVRKRNPAWRQGGNTLVETAGSDTALKAEPLETSAENTDPKPAKTTKKKNTTAAAAAATSDKAASEPGFKDQPIEIVAALLALFGAKADYTGEEISQATELLSSSSHGNTEALASDILAIFQDCNNPQMLNTALVKVGAQVVEWWDDLDGHAARVDFFNLLKNTRSDQRDAVEPVIYWADDTGAFGELKGKGQLTEFNDLASAAELSGIDVRIIDAKAFAKLKKAEKTEEKVDYAKLREEGLALVRAKAATHRDAIGELLVKHGAINPDTNKASWGFISDENVVAGVEALKAL